MSMGVHAAAQEAGGCGDGNRKRRLTLFDTLPETVLFCFAEAGHPLGVTPANEVGLLELAHERLFACICTGRKEELLRRRRGEMECDTEGREERGCYGLSCRQGDGITVVNEPNRPMPAIQRRYVI